MKKRTFKSLLAALFGSTLLLLSNCTKLDEELYSTIGQDQFTPTEKDVIAIMAPVYTNLRPLMCDWQGLFDLEEESGDHIITPVRPNGWYDGGTYQRMHRHEWTSTQYQPSNVWNLCYTGINTANRVIYQIESGEVPITSGKENTIAELKTARAFYYYLLCDNHGNVPIVTDFKDVSLPTQSSRQQVYDFVVKELTDNIPLLNETVDRSTYGRFTKWAAKALLAKVYLNAEVYTGTPQWDKCMEQCDDIINHATSTGAFALDPVYRNIFKTDNENSKELIFAVPYDEIFAPGFNVHMKTLDPLMQKVFPMQSQPWGGSCAVPQFINTYDAEDGRLKDTWIQGPQYDATTKAEVINFVNTVTSMDKSEKNHGFRIGKYEIKPNARGSLSNDFPVFRYADVLMMKAECQLRTGGADGAATLVTEVRQRAFVANPSKAKVTGAQLLQGSSYQYGYWENGQVTQVQGGVDIQYGRFLDELGWEFAAEARRRQDIIRFGVFTKKMWFQHRTSSQSKTLFPIPLEELNKNPNLKQNDTY